MARGIKNRGTQRHEDKRALMQQHDSRRAIAEEVENLDLDALGERALRADLRRSWAFADAVAGRKA